MSTLQLQMIFYIPFLKTAMLWLTTAVSLFGVFPQIECTCPDGSKHTLLPFAYSKCCCAKASCGGCSQNGRTNAYGKQSSEISTAACSLCHSEGGTQDSDANESKQNYSNSRCHKSFFVQDVATNSVAADTVNFDFEFTWFPQVIELSFYAVHTNALKRSPFRDQSPPPSDLIITLRHLVI